MNEEHLVIGSLSFLCPYEIYILTIPDSCLDLIKQFHDVYWCVKWGYWTTSLSFTAMNPQSYLHLWKLLLMPSIMVRPLVLEVSALENHFLCLSRVATSILCVHEMHSGTALSVGHGGPGSARTLKHNRCRYALNRRCYGCVWSETKIISSPFRQHDLTKKKGQTWETEHEKVWPKHDQNGVKSVHFSCLVCCKWPEN